MIVPNKNPIRTWSDSGKMTIRQMGNEDIIPYCTLFQTVFAEDPWNEVWTIPQIQTIITRQMRKKGFLGMAAAMDNGTVGYVTGFSIWPVTSIFYLDQLFIKQDYQGKQIGKRLLSEMEQRLKMQGVSCIFLFTKTHSNAENFYCKNAYAQFLKAILIKGKSIFYKHL